MIDPEELERLLHVDDGPLKNVEDVVLPEPISTKKHKYAGSRRGPKSDKEWLAEIRKDWRYIKDVDRLGKSWLASLPPVQDLAAKRYGGGEIAKGQALQKLLKRSLIEVQQYDMEPITREILKRYPDMGMKDIANILKIDRSQMSRNYTRKALKLLIKAFQCYHYHA